LRVGQAQDAEGSSGRGVPADPERDHLEAYVGQLGDLDERFELAAHDLGAADRPAECRLVDDQPQLRGIRSGQDLLAANP
jgi:hypothetical protein